VGGAGWGARLFLPVKEFAEVLKEADYDYDGRSRQAEEKEELDEPHTEQRNVLHWAKR